MKYNNLGPLDEVSLFKIFITDSFPLLISASNIGEDNFWLGVRKIANLIGYETTFETDCKTSDEYLKKFKNYLEENKEMYSWWLL